LYLRKLQFGEHDKESRRGVVESCCGICAKRVQKRHVFAARLSLVGHQRRFQDEKKTPETDTVFNPLQRLTGLKARQLKGQRQKNLNKQAPD
jgi:hypothetical protein